MIGAFMEKRLDLKLKKPIKKSFVLSHKVFLRNADIYDNHI